MTIILEKSNIPELLENLSQKYLVVNYQKEKTALSAKGYFLAPREKLFSYSFKRKKIIDSPKTKKKLLIFGLDPIDIEAVDQLDEIMVKPQEDCFYFQKRENTIIIGRAEHSISAPITSGDLILEKINENQYRVSPLTKEGEAIARNKFFKKEKTLKILTYPEEKNNLRELVKDSELLA